MKYLNSQQLAFILDIKKEDARAMMCNAWTRSEGMPKETAYKNVPKAKRKKNKIEDPFPLAMPIDILAKELNLPTLQQACDDIENNYLARNATKKFILWDFPEKAIKKFETDNKTKPYKLEIPPALRSMLPSLTQAVIYEQLRTRFELNLTPEEFKELHPAG